MMMAQAFTLHPLFGQAIPALVVSQLGLYSRAVPFPRQQLGPRNLGVQRVLSVRPPWSFCLVLDLRRRGASYLGVIVTYGKDIAESHLSQGSDDLGPNVGLPSAWPWGGLRKTRGRVRMSRRKHPSEACLRIGSDPISELGSRHLLKSGYVSHDGRTDDHIHPAATAAARGS